MPVGCAEAYRNAPVWCNFKDIRETDEFPTVGVRSIESPNPLSVTGGKGYLVINTGTETGVYSVFDTAGQLKARGESSEVIRVDLPAGIYVVTMNRHSAKVRVR